ncbi:hypothetical protein K2X05_13955 [bacterium]|nr:hypothetical protein [bacterium]
MQLILEAAKKYKTPYSVQKFISHLTYNKNETIYSAEKSLKLKTCHCLEATFIAAAILEIHNYEPLMLSMESQDQLDHVVYLFREKNLWGTIGQSRDKGLHGRAPVFKSIESLVRSYFVPYVDHSGRILRYQVFHLDETQSAWRDGKKNLWSVEQYIGLQKHIPFESADSYFRKVKNRFLQYGHLKSGPNWWI